MNTGVTKLARLAVVVVCVAIIGAVRADLIVTNSSGVRAGISGIVYHPSDGSLRVSVTVVDPTGTNVTKYTLQQSSDLKTWSTFFPTNTVTGNAGGEVSFFPPPGQQFYRMQLINFQ